MIAILRWAGSILTGALSGLLKFAVAIAIAVFALVLIGLAGGDGLPSNMVLTLDLRQPMADSAPSDFTLGGQGVTVMDIVLGLDAAGRDQRVKGVFLRVGGADLSVAQAEEIGAALKRFRATGKFVIAHAQGFEASGLGDYLAAAAADQIWMQPKSSFYASGEGGGEFFLRGLLDKIQAEPQMAQRAEYKSAVDELTQTAMTDADREQLTALMQSWYDNAIEAAAQDRKLDQKAMIAAFEASPQFTEDAQKRGLIDKIGYDDDAQNAALDLARAGAKTVSIGQFARVKLATTPQGPGPRIALVEASGDIVDGSAGGGLFGSDRLIAGDDTARAIRQATKDGNVKAIVLRVDSPGGSVTASDQILDAVRKAQAAGKPVIVSMGAVAASGGYFIATSADKIVAEPGTITGSIGVFTGKVAIGKSLGLIGVGVGEVGVGKNTLMNSGVTPYTDEQWKALNAEADAVYADFKEKVSKGRKLSLDQVQDVARGRVWSGADAKQRGLVDQLGGFWTAVDLARKLARLPSGERVVFERYPRRKGFWASLAGLFGPSQEVRAIENFTTLMNAPVVQQAATAVRAMPRSAIELRAVGLPQ
jgi:protease-4